MWRLLIAELIDTSKLIEKALRNPKGCKANVIVGLREDFLDDMAMDIREAAIHTILTPGQLGMVDTE